MACNHLWTKEQEEWLVNNCSLPRCILVEKFNRKFGTEKTYQCINAKISYMGLAGTSPYSYSEEQIQWLKTNYPKSKDTKKTTDEFNKLFKTNKKYGSLQSYCERHGIHKEIPLREFRFRQPIGHEMIDKDNNVLIKYKDEPLVNQDKVKENYMLKSRYLYEKRNNCKLTDDDFIIFLDGDKRNFSEDNLERVNRKILSSLLGHRWHNKGKATKAAIEVYKTQQFLKQFQ